MRNTTLILIFFLISTYSLNLFGFSATDTQDTSTQIRKALASSVTVHVLILKENSQQTHSDFSDLFLNVEENTTGFFPGIEAVWAQGSGFVYSKSLQDYYVVTNSHVVEDYHKIWIEMKTGELHTTELVGSDLDRDIAVLKFTSDTEYPPLLLKPSEQVKVGDTVFTIGSPYQYAFSVAKGIVSGKNRDATPLDITGVFFQTDAAINLGNSGGPLISTDGKLIGLNTFLLTNPSQQSIGLGFSLISDLVQDSVERILLYRKDIHSFKSWLGLIFYNDNLLNRVYGETLTNKGAYIQNIYLDSPAHVHGFLPGDILLSINEKEIYNEGVAISLLRNTEPNTPYIATILRNDKKINLRFQTTARPPKLELLALSKNIYPGVTSNPVPRELNRIYGLDDQIQLIEVTKVFKNSIAERYKLAHGDLLFKINGTTMPNLRSFTERINNAIHNDDDEYRDVQITVIRNGTTETLDLF